MQKTGALVMMLLAAAGCHNLPVGPSLASVSVSGLLLNPVNATANPGECCCHILTTATNSNTVAVDLTIKFSAYNRADPDPFAKIVYFVPNLAAGASSRVDAPGLIVPCVTVDKVLYELEVKGLTSPPSQ